MDYAKTRDIIHSGNLICDEDLAFIDENLGILTANWEKNQRYRTETEMRVSVLNDTKFPTPAAKYWQCIREQSGFYSTLVGESFEYRKTAIKLRQKELELEDAEDGFEKELLQIEVEELMYRQMSALATAKDRMRELRLWDRLIKEQTAIDPDFDTEDVNSHQHVSYLLRWHKQLAGLDRSKSSVSEVNNLVGQYVSGIKLAVERDIELPLEITQDAARLGVNVPKQLTQEPASIVSISANFDVG